MQKVSIEREELHAIVVDLDKVIRTISEYHDWLWSWFWPEEGSEDEKLDDEYCEKSELLSKCIKKLNRHLLYKKPTSAPTKPLKHVGLFTK